MRTTGGRLTAQHHRYGYAGAWGYQSHRMDEAPNPQGAFPYMHVGARYYDPATGRFLQRDPIGIRGGPNVHAYVGNIPTTQIDPTGKWFFDGSNSVHDWMARWFWMRIHDTDTLANMSNTRMIMEGAVAPAVGVGVAAIGGVALASGGGTASLSLSLLLHDVTDIASSSLRELDAVALATNVTVFMEGDTGDLAL